MKRGAGILLPVSSLPSPYGIGSFGRAAYDFVDFLHRAGQSYWQVLPLGPTSYGDSPYQSFSAFAGNPYFIDLDRLAEEGLLTAEELEQPDWGGNPGDVDYAALYQSRFGVLRRAYKKSSCQTEEDFERFCAQNQHWLPDYCLFMALKEQQDGKSWLEWPEPLRLREPAALEKARDGLEEEIGFWAFCQYKFFGQWQALMGYAHSRGVEIIGDLPIYVAMDSADVWAHGELFQLDEQRRPAWVAGVPPDFFSATGQLWGNPLYDWEAMERTDFDWWKQRMAACAGLYDVIRIDHFIGTVNYYSIAAGAQTAMVGDWHQGPGMKLFAAITPALGGKKIIAEDLGVLTAPVVRLRERCGYPGMKVLQFAFDGGSGNEFLPHHHQRNQVVYPGTHDNQPLRSFLAGQKRGTLRFARQYLGVRTTRELPQAVLRACYASVANTAIVMLQDLMGLGDESRINTPSTMGENWRWRLLPGQTSDKLAEEIRQMTKRYGRYREND